MATALEQMVDNDTSFGMENSIGALLGTQGRTPSCQCVKFGLDTNNSYMSDAGWNTTGKAYGAGGIFSETPGYLEKTQYALVNSDCGYGTNENITVDYWQEETIKIYTDPLNNRINVGHEPFGTPHPEKTTIDMGPVYPAIW